MRSQLLAVWFASTVLGCGEPILRNVPHPNTAAAAGVAAGAAAAMTLLDPNGAAKRQEERKPEEVKQETAPGPTVPKDVLDRLDAKRPTPDAGVTP